MRKEEFIYNSADNRTTIRAVFYYPEIEPIAVLQIAHGMCEFIDRYDKFAKFLCDNGFVVCGNDHLGHGESVVSKEEWGYFAENDGYKIVLKDIHTLTTIAKEKYPNIPYFLLGHSMGSFFCRYYLCEYPNELTAAIVMGTGQQTSATLKAGKVLCKSIAAVKGWKHRSKTVNATAIGSYNKKWEPSNTHCDWLTKDEEIVNAYVHEPKCQYVFTVNGYYNLFSCIEEIINPSNLNKMNKNLPVLLVSGKDDPVGEFGKSVEIVYNEFMKTGMKDVQMKLYDNDRHEILNETDKDKVYLDILNWLKEKM